MNDFTTILAGTISAGTPIIFALCGDLVGQRAGITSLSVEGSMLCGACLGFGTLISTGSLVLAVIAAGLAGMLIGLIQAFLVIDRKTNMMASGFVLIFLAKGITAFYGRDILGQSVKHYEAIAIPLLSKTPVIGPTFFTQDILTYFSYLLPVILYFVLFKTRLGLAVRSMGERPEVTLAYGYNPRRIQYGATLFAGLMAGIGGAQMSIFYTMNWSNDMVKGRGIIASSLVILCGWKPQWAYMAAYLFGLAQALQVYLQINQVPISMYVTLALPYLLTLAALAIVSTGKKPSMPEKLKIITDN